MNSLKMSLFALVSCMFLCFTFPSQASAAFSHQNIADRLLDKKDSTEVYIRAIRAEFTRINRLENLRVDTIEANEYSTEGGEIRCYYEGKKMVKLTVSFYGEMGRSYCEYYLRNGNLIFSYQQKEEYEEPIGNGKVKVKLTEEQRFYLNNEQLIHYIDNSGNKLTKEQLLEKQKFILEEWSIMLNEISRK